MVEFIANTNIEKLPLVRECQRILNTEKPHDQFLELDDWYHSESGEQGIEDLPQRL